MKPEVTIGLTFYNSADTLRDSLRSIFSQSFRDWELIIIDDHSTDGSYEIAMSVNDRRVKVFREEKRLGFVNALNRMTELANGSYYARMDSDDMMHPERLSRQLEYLKLHTDIDVVDTAMCSIDREGNPVGMRGLNMPYPKPVVLLRGSYFHHATVMGHTNWFRKNPYNPVFVRAEDCELWCRTFNASRFARLNEPLYFVREGLVNIRNYLDSVNTVRQVIRTHGPQLVGKPRILQLICESYMKGFAYRLFGSVGSHDILVNLRNRKLRSDERMEANKIINHILSTEVPGL